MTSASWIEVHWGHAFGADPHTSPTKWHRAHTNWFFEQFLLSPNLPGYALFDEGFAYPFNSYYVAAGPRHARPQRGLVTRPGGVEVAAYRVHLDEAVDRMLARGVGEDVQGVLEVSLNHEQQHQELNQRRSGPPPRQRRKSPNKEQEHRLRRGPERRRPGRICMMPGRRDASSLADALTRVPRWR